MPTLVFAFAVLAAYLGYRAATRPLRQAPRYDAPATRPAYSASAEALAVLHVSTVHYLDRRNTTACRQPGPAELTVFPERVTCPLCVVSPVVVR